MKEFHDYVVFDAMEGIPGITSKRMFGGYGLYKDKKIFAIITSDSQLYFKIDEGLKVRFKEYGSEPFIYEGKNKPVEMPYWLLPEEVLENKELLEEWIGNSASVQKGKKV